MLQGAVTHARRTSPHLNTKYKKLNRNKIFFQKTSPQAREVRRMLQQNLNQINPQAKEVWRMLQRGRWSPKSKSKI